MEIYFESEPVLGVNITYSLNGELERDYFSSMYLFTAWASLEYPSAELIEITDSNYRTLHEQGLI